MTGLLLAARYLTVVPLPGPAARGLDDLGRAAVWFPLVGVAVGLALVLVDVVASFLFPPLLTALLTLAAWKGLTGGLHLDGLADCLDGLVGRDPQQRLAIMRDSRIGAFGAIGLILFLLMELGALAELPPPSRRAALIAAPTIGRATPAVAARVFAVAAGSQQAAAFRAGLGRFAAPVGLAVAVALGVCRLLAARLGGITGDVLGAGLEIAELTVLLTVAAWLHGAR